MRDLWSQTLTFTYDAAGNRTLVQDSQGGTTTSTFDAAGHVTRRDFNDGTTPLRVDQTYDGNGQVTHITRYGNLAGTLTVATTDFTFDADGQVTNILSKDGANATISNLTYTYDAAHRLTGENNTGTLVTYTHGNSNQLTADGATTVTYDATGNRNNGSYTTGTGNQLSSDGTWNFIYDNEGNLAEKDKIGSNEKWTYGYDNANRLLQAKHYDASVVLVLQADYKYDAFGEQIEVDEDGSVLTRFGIDGWNSNMSSPLGNENMNVWARFNSGGTLTTRYQWGNLVDQQLGRIDVISGTGTAYWLLLDRLNSVRDVIDSGAVLKDSIKYDGFGKVTSETAPSFRGWYAWTGREYDFGLNLQYNHARWYDPKMGRWISQDPLGFDAGDSNLYRYVNNRATGATDPSGLQEGGPPIGMARSKSQVTSESPGKYRGLSDDDKVFNKFFKNIAGEAKDGDNSLPTKYGIWSWEQSNSIKKGNLYVSDMKMKFTPYSEAIKSDNISFVQLIKKTEIGTGKEAEFDEIKLARTTPNKWRVDRVVGKVLGWYGYDDPPKGASDLIVIGNTTKKPVVPAELWDDPRWDVGNVKVEFQTFAIAKDGNGGKVLSGLYWGFTVDKMFRVKSLTPKVVTNFQDFKESASAWNVQADLTGEKVKLRNSPKQQRFGDFVLPY